jgi:uncharacterized protein (TIGR00156 family)
MLNFFDKLTRKLGFGGGSRGPGPDVITVEQAKGMKDDSMVKLRGKVIRRFDAEHFEFQDETGTIEVEIENRRWRGQDVGPDDMLEIFGEVDWDDGSVEIEVKWLTKLSE